MPLKGSWNRAAGLDYSPFCRVSCGIERGKQREEVLEFNLAASAKEFNVPLQVGNFENDKCMQRGRAGGTFRTVFHNQKVCVVFFFKSLGFFLM